MNSIFKRRSIRSYNEKTISDENILKIIKAGFNAPSAMNKRPSKYIIISDKKILETLSLVSPNMFMLSKCDKAIVVIGLETSIYWQQDLAASTENMLLMAECLNISSCWMGIAPNKDFENEYRKILSIPKEFRILSSISLGYSDKIKEENNYFDENSIYYDKFN